MTARPCTRECHAYGVAAMHSYADYVPGQLFQPTLAVSPDGRQVAYSSNVSGQYNVWVADLDEAVPPRMLTALDDRAVRAVAWSPDGVTLAFAADTDGDEQTQIELIDVSGRPLRSVTTAADRQHVLGRRPFSRDGRCLAYAANDRDPAVQDVVIHDLEARTARRVESTSDVLLFAIAFSPDGSKLMAAGARSNSDADCVVIDLADGNATARVLTSHEGDEYHVPGPWTADSSAYMEVTDDGGEFSSLVRRSIDSGHAEPVASPAWDVEHVAIDESGALLIWCVNEGGTSVLHTRRDGVDRCHHLPPSAVVAMSPTPDGTRLVVLIETATRPADIAVLDLATDELRYLTDSRPAALRTNAPVEPELVEYPSHDGRQIPGWLYRPATADVSIGVPIVVSIHGGPEFQERATYSALYQYLLANGVAVFAPNVRGSTGYGRTYQLLIHRDWGGDELRDFEHANRYLRSLSWVDGDRIGVFGGSFGGFATLSCVARLPDLWAAGVSLVGPSNLHTFVRSVPPTWRALMAAWVGDPETDAELLTERSPITYVDQISAPLMIVQGANDPRVAKAESDQIVDSLRMRGIEVRYDVYDDEGHGFTRRSNEIKAMGDVGDFLVAHLG